MARLFHFASPRPSSSIVQFPFRTQSYYRHSAQAGEYHLSVTFEEKFYQFVGNSDVVGATAFLPLAMSPASELPPLIPRIFNPLGAASQILSLDPGFGAPIVSQMSMAR
jgi:hypothetical protein